MWSCCPSGGPGTAPAAPGPTPPGPRAVAVAVVIVLAVIVTLVILGQQWLDSSGPGVTNSAATPTLIGGST